MATLWVETFLLLDLWFKSIRISLNYGFNSCLPFFIIFLVSAFEAVALRTTTLSKGEAIAVQFEAFRLLTVASVFASCTFHARLNLNRFSLWFPKIWRVLHCGCLKLSTGCLKDRVSVGVLIEINIDERSVWGLLHTFLLLFLSTFLVTKVHRFVLLFAATFHKLAESSFKATTHLLSSCILLITSSEFLIARVLRLRGSLNTTILMESLLVHHHIWLVEIGWICLYVISYVLNRNIQSRVDELALREIDLLVLGSIEARRMAIICSSRKISMSVFRVLIIADGESFNNLWASSEGMSLAISVGIVASLWIILVLIFLVILTIN